MVATKTYMIDQWEQGNGQEPDISFMKPGYDDVQVWYREEIQIGTVKAAGLGCLVFQPRESDFDEEIDLSPTTGDGWADLARRIDTEVAG